MRVKFWPLIAGFALATAAVTSASAFESWSAPGYYLLEDYYLVSGPYANEDECNAALAALPAQERYDTNAECDYEETDPDAPGADGN